MGVEGKMKRLISGFLVGFIATFAYGQNITASPEQHAAADSLVGATVYFAAGHEFVKANDPDSLPVQYSEAGSLTVKQIILDHPATATPFNGLHVTVRLAPTAALLGGTEELETSAWIDAVDATPANIKVAILKMTKLETHQRAWATVAKGMSTTDLYYLVGQPESTNSYGADDYQLVYDGGRLVVYTDGHVVTNVQRFGR